MKQANLKIDSIGETLKAAREKKGLSISEVASATRILSKCITSMEKDDFHALAAPVYAKSFIKLYAKYLGLESGSLIESYEKEIASSMPSQTPIAENVRKNLIQVDKKVDDTQETKNEDLESNSSPILSKWTLEPLKSFLTNFSLEKITQYALAGVFILIVILLATCGGSEEMNEKAIGTTDASVLGESNIVPDIYLNSEGSIDLNQ